MVKTILGTYQGGKIAPAERLALREGQRVRITVTSVPEESAEADGLEASAGGWAELLDIDAYLEDMEESRHRQRPPVEL